MRFFSAAGPSPQRPRESDLKPRQPVRNDPLPAQKWKVLNRGGRESGFQSIAPRSKLRNQIVKDLLINVHMS